MANSELSYIKVRFPKDVEDPDSACNEIEFSIGALRVLYAAMFGGEDLAKTLREGYEKRTSQLMSTELYEEVKGYAETLTYEIVTVIGNRGQGQNWDKNENQKRLRASESFRKLYFISKGFEYTHDF